MSRQLYSDVTAKSLELVDITILANTGDGSSVDILKGVQDYDKRIVAWEVVENGAAFEVARAKEMAAPKLSRAQDLGFAPPVSKFALSELFLRSTTDSTVAAVLILYLAGDDAIE